MMVATKKKERIIHATTNKFIIIYFYYLNFLYFTFVSFNINSSALIPGDGKGH